MKKQISIILAIAAIIAFAPVAKSQTNAPSPGPVSVVVDTFKDWFRDNTNFWGQQTAIVGVSGLYSFGKVADSSTAKKSTYGAALDLRFPLDEKGQASIGLWGAWFNQSFFAGSLTTTLGKTIRVPVIEQDIFMFAGGGPGVNLNNPESLIGVAYTGAVWKKVVSGGDKPLTLYVHCAVSKVTQWDGNVVLFGGELGKRF